MRDDIRNLLLWLIVLLLATAGPSPVGPLLAAILAYYLVYWPIHHLLVKVLFWRSYEGDGGGVVDGANFLGATESEEGYPDWVHLRHFELRVQRWAGTPLWTYIDLGTHTSTPWGWWRHFVWWTLWPVWEFGDAQDLVQCLRDFVSHRWNTEQPLPYYTLGWCAACDNYARLSVLTLPSQVEKACCADCGAPLGPLPGTDFPYQGDCPRCLEEIAIHHGATIGRCPLCMTELVNAKRAQKRDDYFYGAPHA